MDNYSAMQMQEKVAYSLATVKQVLDQNRDPLLAGDVQHEYADKYLLAEVMTGAASASALSSLELLGLKADDLRQLVRWAQERSVTLAFHSTETCGFIEKKKREVEAKTKHVTEYSGRSGSTTVTDKVITTITEWFWNYSVAYEVIAYAGTDKTNKVVLLRREGKTKLKTSSEGTPYPKSHTIDAKEVNITWLLQRASDANQNVTFEINRAHKGCHTPRRNKDVAAALTFFASLDTWGAGVSAYLSSHIFKVQQDHGLDLSSINADDLFVPVLPLLEDRLDEAEGAVLAVPAPEAGALVVKAAGLEAGGQATTVLPLTDLQSFLSEEKRSLGERFARNEKTLPRGADGNGVITAFEGRLVVVGQHLVRMASQHRCCVDYIEHMLYEQLVKAIGKQVTSKDFGEYMRFHARKLFKKEYLPSGFSYAVRRPQHNPEGTVSIESNGEAVEPVLTMSRSTENAEGMRFALNAAADVTFKGTTFLHGYMGHRFSTEEMPQLSLIGRARQFSGFIMLIGSIGGKDLFLPKHAMIVKNKDDYRIPLLLEEIPTAQEFKDAIESLSPEQQRFAKAYRGMQLEATLFGVCVVQIKPQLERVLNLPADALTKEIALTQDLLDLFITYQIPSDLLSYKCDDVCADVDEIPASVKVAQVQKHVTAMLAMLKKSKEAEIAEEKLIMEKRLAEEAAAAHAAAAAMAEERCYEREAAVKCSAPSSAMRKKRSIMGGAMRRASNECAAPAPKMMMQQQQQQQQQQLLPQQHTPVVDTPASQTGVATPESSSVPETPEASPSPQDPASDISTLPNVIEARFEQIDPTACVRPTIIKTGPHWTRKFQKGLLSKPNQEVLTTDGIKTARDAAFDLLDALTRSGVLSIDDAELHVVVASTHCFDKTLMDTVVQDNVNPVEQVEKALLIVASALHSASPLTLVNDEQVARLQEFNSVLFLKDRK